MSRIKSELVLQFKTAAIFVLWESMAFQTTLEAQLIWKVPPWEKLVLELFLLEKSVIVLLVLRFFLYRGKAVTVPAPRLCDHVRTSTELTVEMCSCL